MFVTSEAILIVNKLFNLPARGTEQDWELELADATRIVEFINYLSTNKNLSFDIKYATISLIISSYDDYLNNEPDDDHLIWEQIERHLNNDLGKYNDLLNYWAIWDEKDLSNVFNITPVVRKYLLQTSIPNIK